MVTYELPSGERFGVDYDLCRGARYISFTERGGRVIYVPCVSTWDEITAAYRAWRNR